MPLDSAAAVSMCSVTAAQGVFYRQGLPCPFWKTRGFDHEGDINYLVYGASSSLGMYAAQMVRIAACPLKGRKVRLIGVASKGKHDFLRKEYGYDQLVDYRDNDWVERVKALGGADYAFDPISEGDTFANIQAALSPRAKEGSVVVFVSPPAIKYKVAPTHGSAWEALGVEISFMGESHRRGSLTDAK
jgi:NADPH:quinone reductase-like Zn-dependent oxidoreductase